MKKELEWIDECGAKARKQALMNAEKALKNYMKGKANRPRFKKKRQQQIKAYFPKNNEGDWTIWRYEIQVPTIGKIKLKEKGYLPLNAKVRSGTISYKAGKYYVSVLIEIPDKKTEKPQDEGIGIDLGVKNLAIMSNGVVKPNINKTLKVIKLNRKLRREQRRLSRKYETKKKRGETPAAYYSANIEKQKVKIQRIYQTLTNIRIDYENKSISEIVKRKPSFIVLEDLNIRGMMKKSTFIKGDSSTKIILLQDKVDSEGKTSWNRSENR